MRFSPLTVLAGLLLHAVGFADTLSPDDFAYGFTVQAEEGTGPLWELDLPDDVYRGIVQPDLSDLRVFNAAGGVVPHAVTRPPAISQKAPAPFELPFFPLHAGATDESDQRILHIVTDETGAIVDTTSEPFRPDTTDRLVAFLVDTSTLERGPNRLVLDWDRREGTGFAVTVDVLASDDLSRWSTLASDVTLADLQSGGAALLHNEIALPGHKTKYLRINWPKAIGDIKPTRIRAFFASAEQPPPRHTIEVRGTADDQSQGSWLFDAEGFRPVDKVRVLFPSSNMVLQGSLYSRATPDGNWHLRHSGIIYSLEREGATLESAPIQFTSTADRYWRFVAEADQDPMAEGSPTLELGWIPHHLTFVARGSPPYTVAFGNALVKSAQRPVAMLLKDIGSGPDEGLTVEANASAVFTLGGEEKRLPTPPPLPWKEWVLWAVLLAGVVLLAMMVRRLLRQMGTPDKLGRSD